MNFRVLEKINLSSGKVLEKSWKFVSEKGYELYSNVCQCQGPGSGRGY